jgi:hypothetical protein
MKKRRTRSRGTDWITIAISVLGVFILIAMVYATLFDARTPDVALAPENGIDWSVVDHEAVRRIDVAEAKYLMEQGQAVLVDTRSEEAYQQKHAQGAIWLPFENIATSVLDLPDDKLLVLY